MLSVPVSWALTKGEKIAQVLVLTHIKPKTQDKECQRGFGSMDRIVVLTSTFGSENSRENFYWHVRFEINVSIISLKEWPLQAANTAFVELGTKNTNAVYQSVTQLLCEGPEGLKAVI